MILSDDLEIFLLCFVLSICLANNFYCNEYVSINVPDNLLSFTNSTCIYIYIYIYIYYSFDTGGYHESVGLVFTRVPQARA